MKYHYYSWSYLEKYGTKPNENELFSLHFTYAADIHMWRYKNCLWPF